MKKTKIARKVFLSLSTDRKLREYIHNKSTVFNSESGLLSKTVDHAIIYFLENNPIHAHTQITEVQNQQAPIRKPKNTNKLRWLKQEIKRVANPNDGTIPFQTILILINEIGIDVRTEKTYLENLVKDEILPKEVLERKMHDRIGKIHLPDYFFETKKPKIETIQDVKQNHQETQNETKDMSLEQQETENLNPESHILYTDNLPVKCTYTNCPFTADNPKGLEIHLRARHNDNEEVQHNNYLEAA